MVDSLPFVHRVDRCVTEEAGWVAFGQCYCFRGWTIVGPSV